MHHPYLGFLFKWHYFKSRTLEVGTLIEQEETDVLLITDMEEGLDWRIPKKYKSLIHNGKFRKITSGWVMLWRKI